MFAATADHVKVGIATLTRWSKRLEPRSAKRRQGKIDMAPLARDVEVFPEAYQRERAACFGVCQKALRRLKVTYKKPPEASEDRRRQTASLSGTAQGV